MDAQSFKDRFGLDFLASNLNGSVDSENGSQPTPRSGATTLLSTSMEAVLASYSALVLNAMKAADEQTVSLFSLAQSTSTRFEGLVQIMQYLVDKGQIELVREDPSGNDVYRVVAPVTASV